MKKILAIAVLAIISVIALSSFIASPSASDKSTILMGVFGKKACHYTSNDFMYFYINDQQEIRVEARGETVARGMENPYAKPNMCDESDDNWRKCFKYYFRYGNKTFYYNN